MKCAVNESKPRVERLREAVEHYAIAWERRQFGLGEDDDEAMNRCLAIMAEAEADNDRLRDELANADNHRACAAKVALLEREFAAAMAALCNTTGVDERTGSDSMLVRAIRRMRSDLDEYAGSHAASAAILARAQRDYALGQMREAGDVLARAFGVSTTSIVTAANEVVVEGAALEERVARAEKDLLRAHDRLCDTRWTPSGVLSEWAKTEAGRNHEHVTDALSIIREALAYIREET